MGVIFSTVLLFIIFLPGLLFRLGFYSPPYSRKLTNNDLGNQIYSSIIPGLIIQILGILFVNIFTDYSIKFSQIILLIQGNTSSPDYNQLIKNLDKLQNQIILYNVIISSLSLSLGIGFKTLIRKLKIENQDITDFPIGGITSLTESYLISQKYPIHLTT